MSESGKSVAKASDEEKTTAKDSKDARLRLNDEASKVKGGDLLKDVMDWWDNLGR